MCIRDSFMPAHDIIGQDIAPFIRTEGKQAKFFDLMKKSYDFLQEKAIPANGMWMWGASVMPEIKGDTRGRVALSETLLMDGITTIAGLPNIGTKREGQMCIRDRMKRISRSSKYGK